MVSNEELILEQASHDGEIRRIAEKLNLKWPCTIEAIIKEIDSLHEKLHDAYLGW